MQELIGQIAATVIGGVIILILAVIAWRGQHHAISTTQYSAAKESVLDFAEVIEEDFSNLGGGLTNNAVSETVQDANCPNEGGFSANATAFDTTSATRTVEFYSWVDREATVPDDDPDVCDDGFIVKYEWTATGNTVRVLDGATYVTKPTYRIERFVKPASGGAYVKNGESVDTVTEFTIDLFDADGNAINLMADLTQGYRVRTTLVTLKIVSPLGGGQDVGPDDPTYRGSIDETRWSRTIRPINLARVSNS